jgi:CRISPR system Cascade subunit CasE
MYLSRLSLDPRSRQARRDLAEPYELHRTLLRAFPGAAAGGPGRVLYRPEYARDTGLTAVLVQSPGRPAWDALPEDYLREAPACRSVEPAFAPGRSLPFRLRANPSAKRRREGQRQGRREGLLTEDLQRAWLEAKAAAGGFRVLAALIVPEGFAHGHKGGPGGQDLTHLAVRFDGRLTVTDPAAFRRTLEAGVGSGKGFGFGLLSVPYPEVPADAHAS